MSARRTCASHPQTAAGYQCDGCGKLLCDECIEESHRLLLCRLCGERALPIAGDAPATTQERRQSRVPQRHGAYGIKQAFFYPLRGSGLMLFLIALVGQGFIASISFLNRYSLSIRGMAMGISLSIAWLALLVGIQFKIVETTARFEDELPDWPEYMSLGERLVEVLTYVGISLLNWGPLAAFLFVFGGEGLLGTPQLGFWLGAAATLWIGTALAVMAWGAAAVHWRRSALRVDQHVRGLFATGGDGLQTVNLTFLLFGVVVAIKALIGAKVPLVGTIVAGALGVYWTFLAPHLVGLLFRRHAATLRAIYEG